MAAMEHRKPGRPPITDESRKETTLRLPPELLNAVKAEAKRRGRSLNTLFAEYAEQITGVPYRAQTTDTAA